MGQDRAVTASDIRIIIERPEFLALDVDEDLTNDHERELNERVIDVDVFLTDKGASTCTLRFENNDTLLFLMYVILPGNAWWVKITSHDSYEGVHATSARRFRVRRVSGYRIVKVELVSAEADLDIKKDNKFSYSNVTVHEAVIEVGKRLDLVPKTLLEIQETEFPEFDRIANADRKRAFERDFIFATAAKYASLVQSKESDAAFLTKMARKVGYVWWLEDETRPTVDGRVDKLRRSLRFMPRTFDPDIRPIVASIDGRGTGVAELIGDPEFEVDYESNVFFGHGGTNNFWSPVKKQFAEIKNDLTEIEQKAAGQMTPVDPQNQVDLSSSTETFLQRKEEADKLLAAFESALVTIRVRMVGNWGMEPRRLMQLNGFGWVVSGIMWIDSVRHRASRGGTYQMELVLRANAMDLSPRDVLNITSKITGLQDRFNRFEDDVLISEGFEGEKYRAMTPALAEKYAQAGRGNYYKHWLNMDAKK
jgi:hypothetical protein